MADDRFLLSVLVNNEAGVLTRVSGLFARRSFNIDSLSVGETDDPHISRINIAANGDDNFKDQVVLQLSKLHDVKVVELMDLSKTVTRELMLIKVMADLESRNQIFQAVEVFRAKVIDLAADSLSVEITGEPSKLNAFIEYLRPFGIAELCRTGVTAIGRGNYILSQIKNREED